MNGMTVNVCMNDSICHDCGVASTPGGGQWAILKCPNNTEGNKVNITKPIDFVQFCEIRVMGRGMNNFSCNSRYCGKNPQSLHETNKKIELIICIKSLEYISFRLRSA